MQEEGFIWLLVRYRFGEKGGGVHMADSEIC